MSALEKEIQALRMKQSRIEKKQREDNAEVWDRISQLELLTKAEESGVMPQNNFLQPFNF